MSPRRIQFNAARIPLPLLLHTEEFAAAWADWCADKAERGKPLTQRAATIALNKCAELGPTAAVAAIRHSIECGYQGIYPSPTITTPKTTPTAPAPEPAWVAERRHRDLETRRAELRRQLYDTTHPGGQQAAWEDLGDTRRAAYTRLKAELETVDAKLRSTNHAD